MQDKLTLFNTTNPYLVPWSTLTYYITALLGWSIWEIRKSLDSTNLAQEV